MNTAQAARVAHRYVQELDQDFSLVCGQQDKCAIGTQDVALLIEGKIGEVLSLEFEKPITGSNQMPWVGRLVDGRVIDGSVTIHLVQTREEVRTKGTVLDTSIVAIR